MPATPPSADLILRRLASSDTEIKLKAIREVKNQIIGNRTKKLSYIKLGAVPALASALAEADAASASGSSLIVQSAAALGSFACGVDAGVRAVLDAGAYSHLIRLLSAADNKVVDAAARSLRMIYQSKLAPKYDFFKEQDKHFLLSLLESGNENLTGLGTSIVIHSCETSDEQKILCSDGALEKLISLLDGSLSQRDSSLESVATILKNNPEVVSKFVDLQNGRSLSSVIELTKDRYPRTRLLACSCLICVKNSSFAYLQDVGIKSKLIYILLELLDDSGQVGDDASFAFSSLVAEKEDLQRLAFEANAIDKFYDHLQNRALHPKRLEGIFLALAHLCSKLECCRSMFVSLQVVNILLDALTHADANVRTAACICLKSVSRSVKILSAGYFMNERIMAPLIRLLSDPSTSVQVAALGAIGNIVVDFTPQRSTFTQCGGIKELVQLTKSMDASLRLNAVCVLKNTVFHADKMCKEGIFMELTVSSLASLICDPEPSVQEQALTLMRNLVDGSMDCVEYAFAGGGIILDAVGRQLQKFSKFGIGIQAMYLLVNIASGNETHKDAIMQLLFSQAENVSHSFFSRFLRSSDNILRTAAVWIIVNLTSLASPGAIDRIVKLHNVGIVSQIKRMANDPCMDVKLRAKQALGQIATLGDS
ncbi:armadillo repeat-containing protein 8 [Cajanus cajan]|uniref:Armadillo repeat-containing protein 8 n=1 Tax=Cajanus cajan TaxID=3821 RepID=A0A151U2Q9_CAJCA|nr:armadillo repeat-containing protein 8 [Cajanus cajan]XP_020227633.1 armadillo repeat-containing protein 8 [Cajanus cajan]KYP73518.1 Armadillo repeat-containing protein 8 [Cajanus cajan]